MQPALSELTKKALALSLDERVVLARRLWESIDGRIDPIEPEIEAAWLKEADRRWREIEGGKVECIPAEEVMAKARDLLKT